ncbi:MAG: hypothetical protein ABSH28_23005 [Acidobacteriota bacterium]|jgi:hypothetical protein
MSWLDRLRSIVLGREGLISEPSKASVSKRALRRLDREEKRALSLEEAKVAAQREAEEERRRRVWAPLPDDFFEAGDEYEGGDFPGWLTRNGEPMHSISLREWIEGRRR